MSELDGNIPIEKILAELNEARLKLDAAVEEEKAASARLTDAQNVYNGTTRRLDVAMRKLRESAPKDTDWNREEGRQA